jgi:hypothetical protein
MGIDCTGTPARAQPEQVLRRLIEPAPACDSGLVPAPAGVHLPGEVAPRPAVRAQGAGLVGDGRRALDRRVVAGPVGQAHDVVVRLDHAGDHGAPAEVDHVGARVARDGVVADGRELAVLHGDRRDDAVGVVHRVDAAVDQHQVGRVVGGGGHRRAVGIGRPGRARAAAGREGGDARQRARLQQAAPRQLLLVLLPVCHVRLPLSLSRPRAGILWRRDAEMTARMRSFLAIVRSRVRSRETAAGEAPSCARPAA